MFLEAGLPTVTQEKVLTWIGKGADIFFQMRLLTPAEFSKPMSW